MFMHYSRPVFNNYLKRMGVTEQSCTERQCMVALSATSDELSKYDMVKDRLRKYAGPQCFPHLDPSSSEYRVRANEVPVGGAVDGEGGSGAPSVNGAIVDERNWLQCCRCKKWRFIAPACAPVFAGEHFFSVRDTDVDWQSWLGGAAARFAAAEQGNASGERRGDVVDKEVASGETRDRATERREQAAGKALPHVRRRRRQKSAERTGGGV